MWPKVEILMNDTGKSKSLTKAIGGRIPDKSYREARMPDKSYREARTPDKSYREARMPDKSIFAALIS